MKRQAHVGFSGVRDEGFQRSLGLPQLDGPDAGPDALGRRHVSRLEALIPGPLMAARVVECSITVVD